MAFGLTQPLTEMNTSHINVPTVLKSGSLKFLEPSEPLQACNGIALPLTFTFTQIQHRTDMTEENN